APAGRTRGDAAGVDPTDAPYASQRDNWAPRRIIRNWLTLGEVRSPPGTAARYYSPRMGSGRDCMRRHASATAWALSLFAALAANTSHAADLIWEVESPFRFFKPTRAFALHEAAFNAVRGDPSQPLPADIIWRTAGAPNHPVSRDPRPPAGGARPAGRRYQQGGLGGAVGRWGEPCYDSTGRPRRYSALCERRYSWGTAREDYVLPEAHTVAI